VNQSKAYVTAIYKSIQLNTSHRNLQSPDRSTMTMTKAMLEFTDPLRPSCVPYSATTFHCATPVFHSQRAPSL